MSLLSSLEIGTYGLRLELDDSLIVMEEDEESVRLSDGKGVMFWLFFFHDLHMDLSVTRVEDFRAAAHCHARAMFNKSGETDDHDGPLRTEDPAWSPLVDFGVDEVCDAPCLRTIHRMVYRPGREVMMGHLLIPLEAGLFEARVMAIDETTGFRESVVMMSKMEDSEMSEEDLQNIDPRVYDAAELDAQFPDHCLSRVRSGLRAANSWIADVRFPAPKMERTKAQLRCIKGWLTAPQGFTHNIARSGKESDWFERVSFCGTDGVDTMMIALESKKRHTMSELRALAESITLRHHETAECESIELTVAEHARESGGIDVSVIVDFHGARGVSRNHLYWFLDVKGRALSISRLEVVAVPSDEVLRESQETARTWQPSSKLRLW